MLHGAGIFTYIKTPKMAHKRVNYVSLVIGLMPLPGFLCKTFQSPSALTPGQLSASTGMVSTSSHERSVNQQTPRETQEHPKILRLFAPGIP